MLKVEFLPENTRQLFERLMDEPVLRGFTLVGGSALALQIGHRISEDLDLALLGRTLPAFDLSRLVAGLEREGFRVKSLITDTMRSDFRINAGDDIDRYIQDYAINGAKISFYARLAPQYPESQIAFLNAAERIPVGTGQGFDLMGLDGLFAMKSIVLADRIKSRDLFDLMALIRDHGYTLQRLFDHVQRLTYPKDRDLERYKSALTGLTPLDKGDEGFEGIGLSVRMESIYDYFSALVDEYETAQAAEIAAATPQYPGIFSG